MTTAIKLAQYASVLHLYMSGLARPPQMRLFQLIFVGGLTRRVLLYELERFAGPSSFRRR